jgi:hypothetical protein
MAKMTNETYAVPAGLVLMAVPVFAVAALGIAAMAYLVLAH